jgi:hypothetical protein
VDEPNPGDLCRLYYSTGTDASPTWVEITKCKDLAYPITFGEGEANARDNEWAASEPTLIGVEITFGYQYEPGDDAVFDALMTMALGRTAKQFAVADGDIATDGTRYLKLFAKIFGIGNDQPLDGVEVKEFTLKPCRHYESGTLVKPSWVTVSA